MVSRREGRVLHLLHMNDVYNINENSAEICGGAARFISAVKSAKSARAKAGRPPLVLFSGDAFSPSTLSTVIKGKQMPPVLNSIGVQASVFGNHDFDFGLETLETLKGSCNFPWMMSNVMDRETGLPLADGHETVMLESRPTRRGGDAGEAKSNGGTGEDEGTEDDEAEDPSTVIRVGLVGVVEREWLATLSTIVEGNVEYLDAVETATRLAAQLREQGADIVIALTHMRLPNDRLFAQNVRGVDLVLGGHDHTIAVENVLGYNSETHTIPSVPPATELATDRAVPVIKSGSDFRTLGQLSLQQLTDGSWQVVSVEMQPITRAIEPDPTTTELVDRMMEELKGGLDEHLADLSVDLDARFASIRTKECNVGNFLADILRENTCADIAFVNSGTLRSDRIHPVGPFRMRDLVELLPMPDEVTVVQLTGELLLEALENSVCKWPGLEGRFAQVSGVTFQFDGSAEPGQRINKESIRIGASPLLDDAPYSIAIKNYLLAGRDGYTMFCDAPVVRSSDCFPPVQTMVRNHFSVLRHVNQVSRRTDEMVRRKSVHMLREIVHLSEEDTIDWDDTGDGDGDTKQADVRGHGRLSSGGGVAASPKRTPSVRNARQSLAQHHVVSPIRPDHVGPPRPISPDGLLAGISSATANEGGDALEPIAMPATPPRGDNSHGDVGDSTPSTPPPDSGPSLQRSLSSRDFLHAVRAGQVYVTIHPLVQSRIVNTATDTS